MARFLTAFTAMFVLASPAAAQTSDAYYLATLEKQVAPSKIISSDVLWSAHDNTLAAPIVGDIAKRVCAVLAQNVGAITAFSAGGTQLSADDLSYCNKHARKTK